MKMLSNLAGPKLFRLRIRRREKLMRIIVVTLIWNQRFSRPPTISLLRQRNRPFLHITQWTTRAIRVHGLSSMILAVHSPWV
jgi:hypothetical protein